MSLKDFKLEHQPRGSDGKYQRYTFMIKVVKRVVELWLKKKNFKIPSWPT